MKNRVRRWTGEWDVESALHSHCRTDILLVSPCRLPKRASADLMAPSNVPGRKPKPCPISCKNKSPSTSRSSATSDTSALPLEPCCTYQAYWAQHPRRPIHDRLLLAALHSNHSRILYRGHTRFHPLEGLVAEVLVPSFPLEHSVYASYLVSLTSVRIDETDLAVYLVASVSP